MIPLLHRNFLDFLCARPCRRSFHARLVLCNVGAELPHVQAGTLLHELDICM